MKLDGISSLAFGGEPRNGNYSKIKIPCGQCIGCRLERSRQWAIRCMHEAQMHEANSFITLTFNDESLYARERPHSLDKREFQLFMKKLRKAIQKTYGRKIRFYMCGEYGSVPIIPNPLNLGRPHYHACIFGFDFPDKKLWKVTKNETRLYVSDMLNEIWGNGYCVIGDVTFQSAAYVARYIMKKQTGQEAQNLYADIDPETGEIYTDFEPEYNNMSRRPGIGKSWLEKYLLDVYPKDEVILNGKKVRPPRYYDNVMKALDEAEFEEIQFAREQVAADNPHYHDEKRLAAKQQITQAKLSKLRRDEII